MKLSDIYESSPAKVDAWLQEKAFIIPTSIETPDEIELASKMMAELVNWSEYLGSLLGSLKYLIRDAKTNRIRSWRTNCSTKRNLYILHMSRQTDKEKR